MSGSLDAMRLRTIPNRIPRVAQVVVADRTGSTNDDARRLAAAGAAAWTVVVAGAQYAGRGRLGRDWFSADGLGLYMSVLLRPQTPAAEAARWTLAAAAAAAEAVDARGAREIAIKWPNDVLASGRKLAGVLSELRTGADNAHELIVGIGFNVHHRNEDFPELLRSTATSLRMAGAEVSREELAASWLERFAEFAGELDRDAWDTVARRWRAFAPAAEGAPVRVLSGAGPRIGVTRGLDATGALRVETPEGETITVRSTESVVPREV